MTLVIWITVAIVALTTVAFSQRQRSIRMQARERLATSRLAGAPTPLQGARAIPDSRVARWLFLAGYRQAGAVRRFWTATIGLGVLGVAAGSALYLSGLLDGTAATLEAIPGRVGLLFLPVILGIPFLLPLMLAALPTTRVRRARRARTEQLLRDLYPALELFASLAQAGLAFDAALARVLTTFGADRPLGRELMTFQAEVLGGADRSLCFRRLAQRADVPQLSSFTSALIRANEAGIGLAATLRRQANELRSELRERALARAQSLPARLVFPLVICFLPGIFVMSLGPAFYGFLIGTAGFGSTR